MTPSPRFPRVLLAGLFALFAAWSLVVPINEAPDEPAHWLYARYLHDHWRLPMYAPGFEEANSPPLAYALFAPLATDATSPDLLMVPEPGGGVTGAAPPRVFLNTGEDYRRYRPQRIARLLACAISLVTVWFVWRAGLSASGPEAGMLAACLVAFLPMFAFRAGHVSNDALLGALAAAATWGLVRLVREPFAWRVAWWTSAAVGLAYLSKISAIALVPPFVLALLAATPAASWPTRARRLGALCLAGVLVAPWSIRNVVLYGDPFASEAMRTAVAHIITDRSLFSGYFVDVFPRQLFKSFVGIFGWMTLMMPRGVYWAYAGLMAAGLVGAAVAVARRRLDPRLVAVLALSCLCTLAVVVRINVQFTQPQGRYLMPALPAFALLLALGLRALPAGAARLASPRIAGSILAAANVAILGLVVLPAYHPAPIRTLATGERVMVGSHLSDLALADVEGRYLVTGPTPSWQTRIEARADAFAAFEVELTATAAPAAQRACVYFASTGRGMHENAPVCVDWLADGRPHVVRLTTRGHPGWSGEISHIRLNPFLAGTGQRGVAVWTKRPRLVPQAPPPG